MWLSIASFLSGVSCCAAKGGGMLVTTQSLVGIPATLWASLLHVVLRLEIVHHMHTLHKTNQKTY